MAGAGYKLFNTGDVLTAQQVNEYLQQQTVMVFANSTARTTALSGVLAEGMMSYLQDTNSVEVYNGSAWVAVGSSPLTTKGDLYTYSTTNARLASSAVNGDVLTVDTSTATGLKWAAPASGGMTLISSTTISNSSFVTLSSIPTTYNQLFVVFRNFKPATDGQQIKVRFNADSSGKYRTFQNFSTGSAVIAATELGFSASQDNVVAEGSIVFSLYDYATTTTIKTGTFYGVTNDSATSTSYNVEFGSFLYNSTSAITSMGFFCLAGNITSGTILLYGVK